MAVSALPGITFTLNGKEVSLEQMSASVAAGADFKLSDPVDLGTVTDLVTMITSQFGLNAGDITGPIDALPDPLKGMASRLMNIDVTVDMLEVHLPPSGSTAPTGSQVKGTTASTISRASRTIISERANIRRVFFSVRACSAASRSARAPCRGRSPSP